jgi:hypothetical protein
MKLTNDFMFSFQSGAINWSNKNQPTIALLNNAGLFLLILFLTSGWIR